MDLLGRLTIAFGVDFTDLDDAGSRLQRVGGQFTALGTALTIGVTAPIAAMGASSIAAAIQFETAMTAVAKTVDAPASAIAALGKEFKNLSESTGTSVKDLARIGEIAGQMGIAAQDIDDFTEIIAALGVATELSTEAAAEGLAKFSNVMGTSIDDVDRLGSSLVALGNAGSSSEAQILEMATRITAAGNQVGLAESEVLAFASSLSDLGIDAEAGGSAISKLFFNMQADVATGGGALEQFAKVANLSVGQFSDLFRKDAASAVLAFVEGLGAMDKESGEAIVALDEMGIKEVRLRNAVLSLAAGHDVLTDALEVGAKGWSENTALMTEAQKFYDSTGQQLEALKNKAVNVAGELGTALLPVFRDLIKLGSGFLDFVRDVVEGFTRLPAPLQAGAVAFVAALAAIGPLLVAGGALLTLLGLMAAAAFALGTTVGTLAAGFLLVPLAFAAVVAAGVAIAKNWDTIKAAALELVGAVKGKFETFAESVSNAWDRVRESAAALASGVTSRFNALAGAVGTAFAEIANRLEVITQPLAHLARSFFDLADAVGDVLAAIAEKVGGVLRPALDLLASLFHGAVDAVEGVLRGLAGFIGDVLSGIANAVGSVLGAVAEKIRSVLSGAFKVMENIFAAGRDLVVGIVAGMVDRILAAFGPIGRIVEFVADGVDGVTRLFRAAADEIVGHSIVPDMIDDIGTQFGRLQPVMVGPTQKASAGVTNAFRALATERPTATMVSNVTADFAKLHPAMVVPAENAVDAVVTKFQNAPQLSLRTEGIAPLFREAALNAVTIAGELVSGVGQKFQGLHAAVVEPAKAAAKAATAALAAVVAPEKIANVQYKVSIDPAQLYAAVIAASATVGQKLNLVAQVTSSLTNTLESQMEAANNERLVREALTSGMEQATRRQELLDAVYGKTELAVKEVNTGFLQTTSNIDRIGRTIALADESTKHLTATQVQSAGLLEKGLGFAGDVVKQAGSNLGEAFSTLKGGAIGLLERFSPLGIASAAMTKAFETLEPVLKPFEQIIEILAQVIAAALLPVLRVMFPIIKLLAEAFTFVGEVVYRVGQGFLLVIGNVVRTVGKLIDALPFVSGKGIIAAGDALLDQADALGDAARAMRDARDALQDLEFDPAPKPDEVTGDALGDFGIGDVIKDVLEGVGAEQVTATQDVGAQVAENSKQTEAAVIAIKEESGILTKIRDVLAAGFGSLETALAAIVVAAPVINFQVPEGSAAPNVTIEAPSFADFAWPAGEVALAALAEIQGAVSVSSERTATAVEGAQAVLVEESATLAQSLVVQTEIRDLTAQLLATLIEKEFSPTIVVQGGGAGGAPVLPRGTDGIDRDLADNFDRQGRYDGDDAF